MDQKILVPDIGDYSNVEVIDVVIKEGDHLKKDDTMITLETDKATMDIPAPFNLQINKVLVKSGDRVSKGSLIADVVTLEILDATELGRIKKRDEQFDNQLKKNNNYTNTESQLSHKSDLATPNDLKMTTQPNTGLSGIYNASPLVRKLARELGVNLDNVIGTAKHGRIAEHDVKSYVHQILYNNNNINTNYNNKDASNNINIDFSKWGTIKEQSLSRIKKKSGQYLHKNWLSIPHVTHFDSADITELENFRKQSIQSHKNQDPSFKLTMLSFIIKAIVKSLQKYPNFNSSLAANGEDLIIKNYYNVGVAVNTEGGLLVPVIKNADQKNIFVLAEELFILSQKARDNKLISEDLQGGCFTISSLGGISGNNFTPIINAPEVAILGVSRHKITPQYVNKELQPRLILPLALSYDHRVIDGVEAASFCKYLVEKLEDVKNFYV